MRVFRNGEPAKEVCVVGKYYLDEISDPMLGGCERLN